jgi:hypothetical protein
VETPNPLCFHSAKKRLPACTLKNQFPVIEKSQKNLSGIAAPESIDANHLIAAIFLITVLKEEVGKKEDTCGT